MTSSLGNAKNFYDVISQRIFTFNVFRESRRLCSWITIIQLFLDFRARLLTFFLINRHASAFLILLSLSVFFLSQPSCCSSLTAVALLLCLRWPWPLHQPESVQRNDGDLHRRSVVVSVLLFTSQIRIRVSRLLRVLHSSSQFFVVLPPQASSWSKKIYMLVR